MGEQEKLPKHVYKVYVVLNNFVEEGKRNVSGTYINWGGFSEKERNEIFDYLRKWEILGYLKIIGDPDTWETEKICYEMKNFIYGLEPLPDNWLREN